MKGQRQNKPNGPRSTEQIPQIPRMRLFNADPFLSTTALKNAPHLQQMLALIFPGYALYNTSEDNARRFV